MVPSPPTRSPVTFTCLLLPVKEAGLTRMEIDRVMESLLASQPLAAEQGLGSLGNAIGRIGCPAHEKILMRDEFTEHRAAVPLVGTDVLGYRLPT